MESRTTGEIKEHILTGRTAEARVLKTISGQALSNDEHDALNHQLLGIESATQDLLNNAEGLEQEGNITQAKAMYEEARRLAMDDPAILAHIKRMDESILLTRAIKKRSQHISETRQPSQKASSSTIQIALSGLVVCALAGAAFFWLTFQQGHQRTPAVMANRTQPEPAASMPAKAPEPITVAVQDIESSAQTPKKVTELQAADTPPAPRAEPPTLPSYTVQKGDSLSQIADRNLCNQSAWKAIFDLNRHTLTDPTKLQPGMQLWLPEVANSCPHGQ